MQVKTIDINAKEWRDKTNGNSYFSAEVITDYGTDKQQTYNVPFTYGYGDQYFFVSLHKLNQLGVIDTMNAYDLKQSGVIIRDNIIKNCKKSQL